jgi:Tol biopolymer transport system component
VPGLANGLSAFVRDRKAGTTSWVSMSSTGAQGNGDVYGVAISADGRYVAFTADSTNLVPGDTNASWDIFVRDRKARTTSRVSVSGTGAQANDNSFLPAISADGRYVLFDSSATNLVPGHTDSKGGVFVRDRKAGTTSRVDVSSTGAQGNNDGFGGAMSPDGRYVAFISFATNLVPGDTNGVSDVFVRDRTARTTSLVSVSGAGKQENGFAEDVGISPDGRYVAFTSGATNLVPGDTNDARDVFLRDRTARTTTRVSVSRTGAQGNGLSYGPAAIGADGRYVAFSSVASNLVPGDTNGTVDVFVRDTRPAR